MSRGLGDVYKRQGYYSLKFVSECGNDAYYKYNKLLLLKERTQELKDEAMELLGL